MKVYSTSARPFCAMAKELLRKNSVQFQDINVASDKEEARGMIETGQIGVPVIKIEGTIIVGFDKDRMQSALTRWAPVEPAGEQSPGPLSNIFLPENASFQKDLSEHTVLLQVAAGKRQKVGGRNGWAKRSPNASASRVVCS